MIPMFCLYYTVIFLTAPFRKVAGCLGKFHKQKKLPPRGKLQFVKEYSPKSLRNREGFWYNRRKPPREAPSWKSTPKTPAAKQWLLT